MLRSDYPDSHPNLNRMGRKLLEAWENEQPHHRKVLFEAQGNKSKHQPDATILNKFNKKDDFDILGIIEFTTPERNFVKEMLKKTEKYAKSHPGVRQIHIYQESQGVWMMEQLAEILADAKRKRYNKRYILSEAA